MAVTTALVSEPCTNAEMTMTTKKERRLTQMMRAGVTVPIRIAFAEVARPICTNKYVIMRLGNAPTTSAKPTMTAGLSAIAENAR